MMYKKCRLFTLLCILAFVQPIHAEVKDNVGGMNTGPVNNTYAAGAAQVLENYSAWVNGESVVGTMSNLTGDVGYKTIIENTIDSKPNAKITLNSTGKVTAGTTYVDVPIETIKQNSPTLKNNSSIFYSSPVDMKQYVSNWNELTVGDFICGTTAVKGGGSHWVGSGNGTYSVSCTGSSWCKYDAESGVLTFGFKNGSGSGPKEGEAWANNAGTVFCVWKGTVAGE